MFRYAGLWRVAVMLVLLAGGSAWAEGAPASPPAAFPSKRMPTLAAAVAAQTPGDQNQENLENLLLIELANQPFLQMVDRQAIHEVMKEHALALSNPGDMNSAITLGKFVGADYLLHVVVEKKAAAIRLVEVASGQVKLEEQLALANDLAIFSAAIREKVLAVLRPESQAANRLTVGIAALPNRSGTDRSDKLSIELQKTLRSRLKDQAWAVVLERQYPTALLEEVDLARAGLVRDKAAETLPPADLVILGTMQDVSNEYEAGKPWTVKLDLAFRLRTRSSQVGLTCRSDAIEAAAGDIVRKIDAFRCREPAARVGVSEKELWRRQALYLMPRQQFGPGREPFHCLGEREKLDAREMIRAWENVLLMDADDPEAVTNLGVCLVSIGQGFFHRRLTEVEEQMATAQCLRGSQLLERALRAQPTPARAHTFCLCIGAVGSTSRPRAREMYQYILDHPDQFRGISKHDDDFYIRAARWELASWNNVVPYAEIERAVKNAETDPDSVFRALRMGGRSGWTLGPLEPTDPFVVKNLDAPDPVVKFAFQMAVAEALGRRKHDPAALAHFDRAIEVMEAAYARVSGIQRMILDGTYGQKMAACRMLGQPEEAKKTALAGAKHFLEVRRFEFNIAYLYYYCVTEVLGSGQEKEALAICDACLAAYQRNPGVQNDYGPRIFERREELLARLAGKSLPDMAGLRLAKGTQATGPDTWPRGAPRNLRMPQSPVAAAGGKIWVAWRSLDSAAAPMMYRPDLDETEKLTGLPVTIHSVAAVKDAVFFGGADGLYKLDTNGALLKHYSRKDGTLAVDNVIDLCEGGGKIYLCFRESVLGEKYGVAVLDPASDHVTVLAPSSREASFYAEPVQYVRRVWWDAVSARLYASCYEPFASANKIPYQHGWMQQDKGWQRYSGTDVPRLIVSSGGEAVLVHILDKQTEFQFLKAATKVIADVPLPWLMGEPAWDAHRIWAPTFTGLYEIDRATGRVAWLAHQQDNPFLSVLKQGNRLYVATGRGLYYREIP